MTKYTLFKVWYFGTNYHGSQRQPGLHTIEGEILRALHVKGYINDEQLSKQSIHSAGRTDAGVHARSMTYGIFNQRDNFYPIEVNSSLPEDIIIWSSMLVNNFENLMDFHPRYQASQREYRYFYLDSLKELNLKLINSSLSKLTGTHDFRNYSKLEENKNTVRTVDKIEFEQFGDLFIFKFIAKSFLWHQIRKMMRVLIQIGKSSWTKNVINSLFDPGDTLYSLKIEPVDAGGLVLWDIMYPSYIIFQDCMKSKEKLHNRLSAWIEKWKFEQTMSEYLKKSLQ